MITGGKLGQIWGRKRAFAIGCVIYGCGSLLTALSQNLTMLLIGWSLLEGIGAALIMPAVVALAASNFSRPERPRAYGLVASAGAIAVAAGPLIGGLFTTYASWRWVFVGEVLVVVIILALARRMGDTPADKAARLDLVGTLLSALGLALVVFGVLRSGTWGLIIPKPNAPEWLNLFPVIWLILIGCCVLAGFLSWERRRLAHGQGVLIDPAMLDNKLLRGGLVSFFFQYLLQAGLFFAVPLFLSVALGLSAIATGVQLLPLSITLLLAAAYASASSLCLPAWSSWLRCLIWALDQKSPPGRCCSPGWVSERSPPNLAPSPSLQYPTNKAARSADCRTPSPTWAPPSAPHSPARS
jgi:MFS family permease